MAIIPFPAEDLTGLRFAREALITRSLKATMLDRTLSPTCKAYALRYIQGWGISMMSTRSG
jgi:hypothetical protein